MVLQAEADNLRDQHGNRLAQHGSFGLNAANAPAEYAEAVNHRGVRVGAHQCVGISQRLAGLTVRSNEDNARQIFQVDLVHDAGVRRHDCEILKSRLSPTQEGVAFLVAQKLQLGVELQRPRGSEFIHLHRVIDHQFSGLQRIDQLGIATQALHGIAHGGEIDHGGYSGEILKQDAARRESNFL